MAYCSSLSQALRYYDGSIGSATHPTSAQAKVTWSACYAEIYGKLAANGITISAAGMSLAWARDIESMITCARIGMEAETQLNGVVSPKTEWLVREAQTRLSSVCACAQIAIGMGATVSTGTPTGPASLATDYPNASLDTSTLEAPLAEFKLDGDL